MNTGDFKASKCLAQRRNKAAGHDEFYKAFVYIELAEFARINACILELLKFISYSCILIILILICIYM